MPITFYKDNQKTSYVNYLMTAIRLIRIIASYYMKVMPLEIYLLSEYDVYLRKYIIF